MRRLLALHGKRVRGFPRPGPARLAWFRPHRSRSPRSAASVVGAWSGGTSTRTSPSLTAARSRCSPRSSASTTPRTEACRATGHALPDLGARRCRRTRAICPETLLDPQYARDGLARARRRTRSARCRGWCARFARCSRRARWRCPTRLLRAPGAASPPIALALDFDGNRFSKRGDGSYELELANRAGNGGCRLRFALDKPVVRHGDDGIVRGLGRQEMFYYFSPRCRVEGSCWSTAVGRRADGAALVRPRVRRAPRGRRQPSVEGRRGTGWRRSSTTATTSAPTISSIARIRRKSHGRWVIVERSPRRAAALTTDFTFEALDSWTSTKTFNEYPTAYRLDGAARRPHARCHGRRCRARRWSRIISPPGVLGRARDGAPA